jgi:hypothetical protein
MKWPFDPEQERKLEVLIQRKLSQLPDRDAPPTLIPRVMAAIQAQAQRPWWQRPFSQWPRIMRILFVGWFGCLAVGFTYGSGALWNRLAGGTIVQEARQSLDVLEVLARTFGTLANALHLLVQATLTQPAVLAGLVVLGMMYLSCIGMGTLWFQLAIRKRTP